MTNDKDMREGFEKWYKRRFSNRDNDWCGHGMEDMEEAWQACRATQANGELVDEEWIAEVRSGRAAVIRLGQLRLKYDFGGETGWTQKAERRGDRIAVRVHYEYPSGPMYKPPITHQFVLECMNPDVRHQAQPSDEVVDEETFERMWQAGVEHIESALEATAWGQPQDPGIVTAKVLKAAIKAMGDV